MVTRRFIVDSRDRVLDHNFVSTNTAQDFVIRLPEKITKLTLVSCEIPLTYYVFNENYQNIVFKDQTNTFYLAIIPAANYNISNFLPIFKTTLENAINLNLGVGTWITDNPGATFTATFDENTNKITLEIGIVVGGIQFISISDPDNPLGIPLGLLPGDIVGPNPILSPIRNTLNNTSRLIGLSPDTTTPDPLITTDGFPLGVSFAFDNGAPGVIPNSVNLSGENYLYIKTDLAGLSNIQQAIVPNIDVNENDLTTIITAFPDRGIIDQLQINQIPFTFLSVTFTNPQTIFLSESTNEINFRITFRNNLPIDVNGVDLNYTIDVN